VVGGREAHLCGSRTESAERESSAGNDCRREVTGDTADCSPAPRCAPGVDRASGIFGKTDSDLVSALIEQMVPVRFPSGYIVFAQGDPGSCLYMIASGRVKVAYRHVDGREVVLNIVGASDVFGEVTAFDYGRRELTATTVTDVCAVAIERDQLLTWIAECPEIIHQIMRRLARRADVMTNCLADVAFADPPYRVGRRLLWLCKRFGRREGEVVRVMHDLTLQEISQFAGVVPETVDAALRDFKDRGWIRFEDDCLEIVDARSIAALPARDESPEVSCG
jgi:CRP/FNR family cyclic AMP-dependent transcriptional regulator